MKKVILNDLKENNKVHFLASILVEIMNFIDKETAINFIFKNNILEIDELDFVFSMMGEINNDILLVGKYYQDREIILKIEENIKRIYELINKIRINFRNFDYNEYLKITQKYNILTNFVNNTNNNINNKKEKKKNINKKDKDINKKILYCLYKILNELYIDWLDVLINNLQLILIIILESFGYKINIDFSTITEGKGIDDSVNIIFNSEILGIKTERDNLVLKKRIEFLFKKHKIFFSVSNIEDIDKKIIFVHQIKL